MKKIALLYFLLLPFFAFSQHNANSHFFKLLVFNQNQEVLLIKFDGEWEIPGSRYKTNTTIPLKLDQMAADHGITIQNHDLKALVTFHHQNRDYPTMMFYYQADFVSGDLVTPSWGQDVKWFTLKKAYELIPYQEMNHIIQSIVKSNDVLEGALEIEYDKSTGKRTGQFKVLEKLK
jgi:hypothetical protein